jgi:hypothetical protein
MVAERKEFLCAEGGNEALYGRKQKHERRSGRGCEKAATGKRLFEIGGEYLCHVMSSFP